MTKDEAEAIHQLARQLLEEDCAVETRQRIARKIIEHARAIKASCMAEPVTRTITVKIPPIAAPTTTQKQIALQIEAGIKRTLQRMEARNEEACSTPAEAREQAQASLYREHMRDQIEAHAAMRW